MKTKTVPKPKKIFRQFDHVIHPQAGECKVLSGSGIDQATGIEGCLLEVLGDKSTFQCSSEDLELLPTDRAGRIIHLNDIVIYADQDKINQGKVELIRWARSDNGYGNAVLKIRIRNDISGIAKSIQQWRDRVVVIDKPIM